MGRRKGSKNKSEVTYESKNITSLIFIFVGLFFAVVIYFNADGILNRHITNILGGLFGNVKLVIPIFLFILGIYGVLNGKHQIKTKFAQMILIMIMLSGFLSWENYLFDKSLGIVENISTLYKSGIEMHGGGVIGGLSVIPFYELFGKAPTLIILIALTCIFVVLTTGVLPITIFEAIKDLFGSIFNLINNNNISKQSKRKATKKVVEYEYEEDSEDEYEEHPISNKKAKFFDAQLMFDSFTGKKSHEDVVEEDDEEVEETIETVADMEDKVGTLEEIFKTTTKPKKEKMVEELNISHTEAEEEDEEYVFPSLDLLASPKKGKKGEINAKIKETAQKLQDTLTSFGVDAKVINVSIGPAVTRYELQPNIGVKVSKIVNLADDIALNLAASNIRIEAPIPGKAAVGIEIPNPITEMVTFRELIETSAFEEAESKLSIALGKDVGGDILISDIAKMPHMLISGSTGSGKSVCINTLITSILYKAKPNEVKLLMIDPKVVELGIYNGIPHLLIPVVTDPKKAAGALNWAVQEMVTRYNLFASKGVKDIKGYNKLLKLNNEENTLPEIVIIVDELADLMMVAANEVEDAICRLAQMARAAGMHLVIATQRPSVDVITGIIKANIPSRIAFAVSSQIDSRTILDMAGAEKLLGKGDMLFSPVGMAKPIRLQGAFISEKEIESIVEFIKENCGSNYDEDIIDKIERVDEKPNDAVEEDDADILLPQAIDMVIDMGQASTSMIQRRFKVGYARAGRIIDQMEARGIITGYDGSKPRQVLVSKENWQEAKMRVAVDEVNDEFKDKQDMKAKNEAFRKANSLNEKQIDELSVDEFSAMAVDGDLDD